MDPTPCRFLPCFHKRIQHWHQPAAGQNFLKPRIHHWWSNFQAQLHLRPSLHPKTTLYLQILCSFHPDQTLLIYTAVCLAHPRHHCASCCKLAQQSALELRWHSHCPTLLANLIDVFTRRCSTNVSRKITAMSHNGTNWPHVATTVSNDINTPTM